MYRHPTLRSIGHEVFLFQATYGAQERRKSSRILWRLAANVSEHMLLHLASSQPQSRPSSRRMMILLIISAFAMAAEGLVFCFRISTRCLVPFGALHSVKLLRELLPILSLRLHSQLPHSIHWPSLPSVRHLPSRKALPLRSHSSLPS